MKERRAIAKKSWRRYKPLRGCSETGENLTRLSDVLNAGLARMRELRIRYMEAHRFGMAALARHDFDGLSAAIKAESAILNEQRELLAQLQSVVTRPRDSKRRDRE